MVKPQKLGRNVRMSFSKIDEALEMPNLIEVQKKSYKWLIDEGLMEVFRDISPISNYSGNLLIDFVSYNLDSKPKYSIEECKDHDANYAAPLKVDVRLTNKQTGEVKQSEIFMGDFPLMTDRGTFIINGAERVIVSQIVRSPGMYYDSMIDKTGKRIYTAQVIPYRGAWLEYETDVNDVFYVKIDKNRKLPVTVLIRALGIETERDIVEYFGDERLLTESAAKDELERQAAENHTTEGEEALKEIYKRLRPGEPAIVESAQILINNSFFDPKRYDLAPVGRYKYDKKVELAPRIKNHKLTRPVISPLTGEIIGEPGVIVTAEMAKTIEKSCVNEVYVEAEDGAEVKVFSNNTVFPEWVLGYDLKDCGVNEKCSFPVLREIIDAANGDEEEIKKQARRRIAELCPKHITKDDIFASVNYLLSRYRLDR